MAQAGRKFLHIQAGRFAHEVGSKTFVQRWYHLRAWITSNGTLSLFFSIVALACNLYHLATPSIWFDEAFSVELARQPLPLLWHILFGLEPNMELYYLLLHVWLAITASIGILPTEFVVRLPSAIFAALSVSIVFWFGRQFLDRTAGILAASLYLLNDLQLVYAQQARSYSLQLLLICIAWYALCMATLVECHRRRWWACFVITTLLAIYAHLFSFFLLLAQLCTFGIWCVLPEPWSKLARRQWRAGLISLICIGMLSVPLLPASLLSLQSSKTTWLPVPQLRDIVWLFVTIGGDNKVYVLAIVGCCALALYMQLSAYVSSEEMTVGADQSAMGTINRPLLLCQASGDTLSPAADRHKALSLRKGTPYHLKLDRALRLRWIGSCPGNLPIGIALMCWLCVPIAASFVISQGPVHLFSSRYLVTVVPALLLLTAMGVTALRWRYVRIILTLGLLLLALQSVPLYYRSAQVEDWNSASFWVEQHYQAGDGLVCYDNAVEQGCQVSVQYYLDAYPSAAHFTADTPGAFSWATFSSANPEAAVDPATLTKFGTKYTRIFFIVGRLPNARAATLARQAQNWLDNHYHYLSQIVTRTVTVRLYRTS